MNTQMTPINLMEESEQERLIRDTLVRQISGHIDSQRSEGMWKKLLENVPHKIVAEVLATELTHFNYEEKKACRCCSRRQ